MKYTILGSLDVSSFAEIEANNPEEAFEKSYTKLERGICCHCSNHLQVGDFVKYTILDEDGNEVLVVDV